MKLFSKTALTCLSVSEPFIGWFYYLDRDLLGLSGAAELIFYFDRRKLNLGQKFITATMLTA